MNIVLILLQAQYESTPESIRDGILFFLFTMVILIAVSLTGKVGIGLQLPGIPRPLSLRYKEILCKYFFYYNALPDPDKKRFEKKVQYFIHYKEFIPRHIEKPTDEMKVLISACAVQLTFGFPKIFLSHFRRILIYPDDYYSTINRTYHRGEVNPRLRSIVLSWRHFVNGYIEHDNGRNLGLHEMAHALSLENRIFNEEFRFFNAKTLKQWNEMALEEIEKIRSGAEHFFRDYAASNSEEFFSVAVENFFEKPNAFKSHLPRVYELMSKLLNQDPSKYITT